MPTPPKMNHQGVWLEPCPDCRCGLFYSYASVGPMICLNCVPPKDYHRCRRKGMLIVEPDGSFRPANVEKELEGVKKARLWKEKCEKEKPWDQKTPEERKYDEWVGPPWDAPPEEFDAWVGRMTTVTKELCEEKGWMEYKPPKKLA